jgi:hypothetical protein
MELRFTPPWTYNISSSHNVRYVITPHGINKVETKFENIQLTPWRKNPKVHLRTHNSPPPVPVLSQSNSIHTPQANFPKIHSDPIFPPTPWSSKWSLSFGAFPPKPCTLFSPLSCVSHAPPTPFDLKSGKVKCL